MLPLDGVQVCDKCGDARCLTCQPDALLICVGGLVHCETCVHRCAACLEAQREDFNAALVEDR